MQTQQTNRHPAIASARIHSRKQSTFLQLANARARRPIRISIPLRRHELCVTRRSMLAALREAEFYDWLNGGEDFADAMHQPVA